MTDDKPKPSAKEKRIEARKTLRQVKNRVLRKASKREAKAAPIASPASTDHA